VRFEDVERNQKAKPMKGEAAVAILASEGLAQVAVICQHARRSFMLVFCQLLLNKHT